MKRPRHPGTTVYWTRERVIDGLRRFARDTGQAPTSSKTYNEVRAYRRTYPWSGIILRYWTTMREAWEAVGIELPDRGWGRWTETEEWYLREAVGILSWDEIANDMGRSPDSVRQHVHLMGVNRYNTHGWTLTRIVRAGVSVWHLRRAIATGTIPVLRGRRITWIDPADLVNGDCVNWDHVSNDLVLAARYGLIGRLVSVLATRL